MGAGTVFFCRRAMTLGIAMGNTSEARPIRKNLEPG